MHGLLWFLKTTFPFFVSDAAFPDRAFPFSSFLTQQSGDQESP
ncbi:hypothetical protein C900_04682 [Fulvivirga imtechensis AK7]|uniref:Uncharacterized protein n=1 Tax=Fulvivirga imtechensis AK7 TaxID=1237149 RepID=L8JLL7_9BACT|nr:hypothetical protein C900_04682 [Fulvivirga imtechensis AK7]